MKSRSDGEVSWNPEAQITKRMMSFLVQHPGKVPRSGINDRFQPTVCEQAGRGPE